MNWHRRNDLPLWGQGANSAQFTGSGTTGHNPNAQIIVGSGPMDFTSQSNVQSVVSTFQSTVDNKILFLKFAALSSSGEGCDGHPNVQSHQAMATLLEAQINKVLGK